MKDKVKFVITHYNEKRDYNMHNSFHAPTLDEALELYDAKGYKRDNIKGIKKHTEEVLFHYGTWYLKE